MVYEVHMEKTVNSDSFQDGIGYIITALLAVKLGNIYMCCRWKSPYRHSIAQ